MDYLMILLIIFLITTICFNMRINKTNEFMSKKQTDILKGICSVIIIFVHIPNNYSNRIQDIISSFGYICVSIFFMLSAYGLKYSLTNKTDYLNKFLLKRLPSVIIPFLIANIINIIVNKSYNPESFKILGFVYVLLIYYVVFYLIYKFCKNRETADSLMITFVILFSVIGKLTNSLIGWQTEQIGFILGILIFNYYQYLKAFFKNKAILKLIIMIVISLLLGILYIKLKHFLFFGDYLLRIILMISIVSLILLIIRNIIFDNKILEILGTIYYEIYLLQVSNINILEKFDISSSTFIIILIFMTLSGAYIMNKFDEKIINRMNEIIKYI